MKPPPPPPPQINLPTLVTPTYLPIILSIYLPAHLATYPPSPSLLANKAGTY